MLPLFKRRTRQVGELLPQLYLHGLAQGDFELALRGLLGEGRSPTLRPASRLRRCAIDSSSATVPTTPPLPRRCWYHNVHVMSAGISGWLAARLATESGE